MRQSINIEKIDNAFLTTHFDTTGRSIQNAFGSLDEAVSFSKNYLYPKTDSTEEAEEIRAAQDYQEPKVK